MSHASPLLQYLLQIVAFDIRQEWDNYWITSFRETTFKRGTIFVFIFFESSTTKVILAWVIISSSSDLYRKIGLCFMRGDDLIL